MPIFVMVHGTGCGGWVRKELAPLLRAGGHEVYTPTHYEPIQSQSTPVLVEACQSLAFIFIVLVTHLQPLISLQPQQQKPGTKDGW